MANNTEYDIKVVTKLCGKDIHSFYILDIINYLFFVLDIIIWISIEKLWIGTQRHQSQYLLKTEGSIILLFSCSSLSLSHWSHMALLRLSNLANMLFLKWKQIRYCYRTFYWYFNWWKTYWRLIQSSSFCCFDNHQREPKVYTTILLIRTIWRSFYGWVSLLVYFRCSEFTLPSVKWRFGVLQGIHGRMSWNIRPCSLRTLPSTQINNFHK